MKTKVIFLMLIFLFLIPMTISAKQSEPHFELVLLPPSNNKINVAVIGHDLQDLYAFEINLEYNAKWLRLTGEKSEIEGYSVSPKKAGNDLQIAHTKVGQTAGENGERILTTMTFAQIGSGTSKITLNNIKLVDSKLNMSVVKPELVLDVESTGGFTDINGHWAETAILSALEQGLVDGYSDGTFRPKKEVTRAEFTAMIVRALQLTSNNSNVTFADKEEIAPWAMPSVQAAVEANLINGYADETFRPNHSVTRAEMAVIVQRALGKLSKVVSYPPFDDASAIPAWAETSINEVVRAGIMQGVGHNQFSPNTLVTRAEAVKAIMNLLDQQE